MATNPRKKLITALKIIFSVALLYFIYTKINIGDVLSTIKRIKPFYIVLAILLYTLSKVLGAFRINLYFHQLKIFLTHKSNLQLTLLGMFYNLFPGGIGGDAYKGYVIKKTFETNTKRVVSIILLDRLSGLFFIFIYVCLLALTLTHIAIINTYKYLPIIAIILCVFTFWLINKKFFGYVFPVFWKSLGYSALVQLAQVLCVICILKALSIHESTFEYLFIFLLSSIASIFSIGGGLGTREATFYYGAILFFLDKDISISVSMVFFLITVLVSLFGIYFHFKKPELTTLDK